MVQMSIELLHSWYSALPLTLTLYHIYIYKHKYKHKTHYPGRLLLYEARLLTLCINSVYISTALSDCAGKAVTFAKEQTVQQKVRMITLGELCDLPKRQLATGFGYKTRKSY